MAIRHTYILILIYLSSFTVISEAVSDIKLLTIQTEFVVGHDIILKFSNSETTQPILYCSNSYGSTLVNSFIENNEMHFLLPSSISNKIGQVHWKLLSKDTSITGTFSIVPKQEVATLETYIGPPSIEAGGTDYTMLVVIPTDDLDNPLAENTSVNAKHQFLSREVNEALLTKHLIAYKTIYSEKESGRILVSSESLSQSSKEFTVNVFPTIPTNFTISENRTHAYADGNQITNVKTSIIKDKYGNIVSDGTFVDFFITNEKDHVLKTSGTTINGIATSKMIHPDYETKWRIKAYVNGIAESDTITLDYMQVIEDFKVNFSENGRNITVGPLKSFMTQIIPDGLQVKLLIYHDKTLLETISKSSFDGFVDFNLKSDIFKKDTYTVVIQTAGLEKTFNSIQLW